MRINQRNYNRNISRILKTMKNIYCVLFIFSMLSLSSAEDMYFGQSQVCVDQSKTTCKKWNITVSLNYYYSYNYYMCFPETTRVMTQNGPQFISNISVGDQILGYNFQKGKPVFASVTAWLHRDTDVQAQFNIIKTKNDSIYLSSNGHNIAYNNEGTIGFKYADELKNGDQLITFGSNNNLTIQSSSQLKYEYGMYSPMTQSSNFYIYPSNTDQSDQQSMILVHCLAQVENPHKNQHWVQNVLSAAGYIGLNQHQNLLHEQYLHPITHLMNLFGGEHRRMKILIAQGDENEIKHLQSLPIFTSSKNNSSSNTNGLVNGLIDSYSRLSYRVDPSFGYGQGFSYGYGYGYGSSSYYNSQQRRQNRKIQMIGVFTCLMQINSILTSY